MLSSTFHHGTFSYCLCVTFHRTMAGELYARRLMSKSFVTCQLIRRYMMKWISNWKANLYRRSLLPRPNPDVSRIGYRSPNQFNSSPQPRASGKSRHSIHVLWIHWRRHSYSYNRTKIQHLVASSCTSTWDAASDLSRTNSAVWYSSRP